jgi:alpha-ketoglutarate-dependent taurine dioxygenase
MSKSNGVKLNDKNVQKQTHKSCAQPDARQPIFKTNHIKSQSRNHVNWTMTQQSDSFTKFISTKRKAVRLSREEIIKTDFLDPAEKFLLVVEPNIEDVSLVSWAKSNRDFITARLLDHGGILFRNFTVDSLSVFESFARTICPELLEYNERAAPRTELGKNLYTSTEYPAEEEINLHHEMSYSHNWPMKIWFFCAQPAESGGRTPVASDRKVFKLLRPDLKETFLRKKVMYVRNFGEGVDLPWQEVFQTNDHAVVEEYCRNANMTVEWKEGDRLRTRQIRPPVSVHPVTGETVWFNHAHMFHMSSLDARVRASLSAEFSEDEFPRNAFYGDGSPIEDSVLEEIRTVYRDAAIRFDWQHGDVLMLDNILSSHGREAYKGPRRIAVAMAELHESQQLDQ